MPLYEYRCRNGHQFEVIQAMTDEPLEHCNDCAAPVKRVFHPIAVHFKGSGFYTTDYGRKKAKETAGSDAGSGDSDGGKSSGTEAGSASPSGESKSEKAAKTESG